MHKLTFFPLGNADCSLMELSNGQQLLFDYADVHDSKNQNDRRIDLPQAVLDALGTKRYIDVVAFTHADDDHTCGAEEFFYLEHAEKCQDASRVKIAEIWVPAALIVESSTELKPSARSVQAEARYRLKEGSGIRVFSRPDRLNDWLRRQGITPADRAHLITDAGQLIPGFSKVTQGVEFFVHSPFAERLDNNTLVDRNGDSLVLQATFRVNEADTCLLLSADTTWETFVSMVKVTRYHDNQDRLIWDIFKLPHHCSYLSLGSEKGQEITEPVEEVKWLFEDQSATGALVISTSDPIPSEDTIQPPHYQAAAYYQKVVTAKNGEFKVTMEHPTVSAPEPLVVLIDDDGARVKKHFITGAVTVTSARAPRAG